MRPPRTMRGTLVLATLAILAPLAPLALVRLVSSLSHASTTLDAIMRDEIA